MSAYVRAAIARERLQLGANRNGYYWAESGRAASWRGSMLSCRLGRSERLAAAANFPDVERYTGTNHPSMRSAAASYCGRKVDQISRAHNRIGIKLIQR